MADRSFVCPDCGPDVVHTAGARGPLPIKCKKHLTAAKNRRARRERRGFRVVDPDAVPEQLEEPAAGPLTLDLPDLPDAAAVASDAPGRPPKISAIVAHELDKAFSTHPAAESLTAAALVLARQLENPLTLTDGRIVATVVRELRATLETLTAKQQEGADVDDPFGFGGVPASVGNASAS